MIKKLPFIEQEFVNLSIPFHKMLNYHACLNFNNLDISLIPDLQDYFYQAIKKFILERATFEYTTFKISRRSGIPQKKLGAVFNNYIEYED